MFQIRLPIGATSAHSEPLIKAGWVLGELLGCILPHRFPGKRLTKKTGLNTSKYLAIELIFDGI